MIDWEKHHARMMTRKEMTLIYKGKQILVMLMVNGQWWENLMIEMQRSWLLIGMKTMIDWKTNNMKTMMKKELSLIFYGKMMLLILMLNRE